MIRHAFEQMQVPNGSSVSLRISTYSIAEVARHMFSWPSAVRGRRVSPLGTAPFAQTGDLLNRYRAYRLDPADRSSGRSEEHTSELQSLMRISYAVFCLKKKKKNKNS